MVPTFTRRHCLPTVTQRFSLPDRRRYLKFHRDVFSAEERCRAVTAGALQLPGGGLESFNPAGETKSESANLRRTL